MQDKAMQNELMQREKKRALRKEVLVRRDSLTEKERLQKSGQIAEMLFAHPWYREAKLLLVYASYASEVSTEEIIRHSLKAGKQIYCPIVTGRREMIFCAPDERLRGELLSTGLAAMKKDGRGIPQPDEKTGVRYRYQPDQSLMLMPGCVFDDERNRIGYGGGFYDTFLAAQPMRTVALFFDCQHTGTLIGGEDHDVRPDLILTESGFR